MIQQRRAARIAWWQRTFRSPLVASNWIFTRATSLWSAFLYLLGLQPKTVKLFSRSADHRSNQLHRVSHRVILRALFCEPLEARQLLAVDSIQATLDGSGNVTIVDVFPSGAINNLAVSQSGANLVITDASEQFIAPTTVGTLSNGNKTLTIPMSSVTGKLILNMGLGSDVVTVDFSGGTPIPAGGLDFNGGENSGDDDQLRLVGYSLTTADGVADVSVVHTGPESGSVVLAGLGTVNFTQIEPLTLAGTAADLSITLPAGADSITLGDDGGANDPNGNTANTSALYDSTGPGYSFEYTEFTHPSNSLTVLRGSPSDNLTILDLVSSGFSASLKAGTTTNRFANANILGAVTLASNKTLSLYSESITSSGPITTSGGSITLDANNGITLTKPILSNGGVQSLQADADGDGTGTLSLGLAIAHFIDPNPATGNQFGATVVILTSGNVVVTSPFDDLGGTDAGAVYLFNGLTGALISTLRGSTASDLVGSVGVTALSNGNYVVLSPNWDSGTVQDAGAVTWGSGTAGVSGVVSASNSLVGSTALDKVGSDSFGSNGVTALSNGNYVVRSANWDNGTANSAGAVTWGSGTAGVSGVVSPANSLVGSTAFDEVGSVVTALSNGNYVVRSANWDNGTATSAGAVTWGSGTTGISGVVSPANSLVGSKASDTLGSSVTALSNGNYVVRSSQWDNGTLIDAGAVTWGSGTAGVSGVVSPANSLVGSTASDSVGSGGVTALSNGNYVVISGKWDNDTVMNAGAVTWGSGTAGISGLVSPANSLVGSTAIDEIGSVVTALSNGNYVVRSPNWDNGTVADAGAVTWGSGTAGVSGAVSSANSLVGSSASDSLNNVVTVLTNGNYVVNNPNWDIGTVTNVGAVTWGSGTAGVSGVVSPANSLVGSTASDFVGNLGATALRNGNYVVRSSAWDNGTAGSVGAVTWGNGTAGVIGEVTTANSLVGSTASDFVGFTGVTVLNNGNYVVRSSNWDNGTVTDVGAVTWGSGTAGVSGVVSPANSLVGSTASDSAGPTGVTALRNGNYIVRSPGWDSGTVIDVGAVTWGNGTAGVSGVVSPANSLVGSTASDSVGYGGVTALSNGNYVVRSSSWDNGTVIDVGAVTWGSGATGVSGLVSPANSLVGSRSSDSVGSISVTALSNGNYVVRSVNWDSGTVINVGAVTWGSGTAGISGVVSPANSLIGSTANDSVGSIGVTALSNGNYVVSSSAWDNGTVTNVGAVTWGSGTAGVSGVVSSVNSAVGNSANAGSNMAIVSNSNFDTLIARFPTDGSGRVIVGSQSQGFGAIAGSLNAGNGAISMTAADTNVLGSITSTSSVSIAPQQINRPIDLGTNTAGRLGLTDAELDLITTNSLQIGSATSGAITVSSSITRPASTNLQLRSGGAIAINPGSINTGGGTLVFDVGSGGLQPISAGTDVTASSVSFTSGDDLAIHIAGATVDTQYRQLNVNGAVNLTGANLLLTSNFPGLVGDEVFTIVSATNGVSGKFNNFPIGMQTLVGAYFYEIRYNPNNVQLVRATSSSVLNRQIFYNRSTSSVFGNGTGNPTNAIDSSKVALLPGQVASFANYSNYVRGLNGLIVDVAGLTGTPTAADFQFAVWNGTNVGGFTPLTATPTITVIAAGGSSGSSRVKIEFADNAIQNMWLRTTVLANANTGLAANDVFYFGHAMGDVNVGNLGTPIIISSDSTDATAVRQNLSLGANSANVTNIYDVNKDGSVTLIDYALVQQNANRRILGIFTAPASLYISATIGPNGMSVPILGGLTVSSSSRRIANNAITPPELSSSASSGIESRQVAAIERPVIEFATDDESLLDEPESPLDEPEWTSDDAEEFSDSLASDVDEFFASLGKEMQQ
ncbi:MAG: hypothetical protein SGI77_11390 [Pirellulaceae bacterium]|nr:hypothetical protein [Pirellulaceae bacterium]